MSAEQTIMQVTLLCRVLLPLLLLKENSVDGLPEAPAVPVVLLGISLNQYQYFEKTAVSTLGT